MQDDDGKLLHRVNNGAKKLDLSRSTIYDLMEKGKLKWVEIAGIRLIPDSEIQRIAAEGVPSERPPKRVGKKRTEEVVSTK